MGKQKDAPKKRATNAPAKTREQLVSELDPSKVIGLTTARKVEKPEVIVTEGNPNAFPSRRSRKTGASSAELAAATSRSAYEAEAKDRAAYKAERSSQQEEPDEFDKRVRYKGEGPESGRPVSETKYPFVTTKKPGATSPKPTSEGRAKGQKPALNFQGSGALEYKKSGTLSGKSSEESYEQSLRSVERAKPHEIESQKQRHLLTAGRIGVPHGADTICDGPGCVNRVKSPDRFAESYDAGNVTWKSVGGIRKPVVSTLPSTSLKAKDNSLCGGDVCTTAQSAKTPTPRGE